MVEREVEEQKRGSFGAKWTWNHRGHRRRLFAGVATSAARHRGKSRPGTPELAFVIVPVPPDIRINKLVHKCVNMRREDLLQSHLSLGSYRFPIALIPRDADRHLMLLTIDADRHWTSLKINANMHLTSLTIDADRYPTNRHLIP